MTSEQLRWLDRFSRGEETTFSITSLELAVASLLAERQGLVVALEEIDMDNYTAVATARRIARAALSKAKE